ncbi:acyltransferase family protein [Arthrobacter sp. NPDC090010]|uniref:acyltransferase family protein n=1 Tax=Arthrobacter sp. NPDC090010 TaxID=3363942 RepID=UPI003808E551
MPRAVQVSGGDNAKQSHFRRDIQGLRAVAVLVVFCDHMFGWPTGGFLGVDVFFVISGFLITGLLLREHERTGHISFRKFYAGRLKRIVPSATAVLLFSVAFTFVFSTRQRAVSVSWDAFWAFVFGANWNFAAAGTDYFQQGSSVSPLQHYWSLSVEEQFYFVWPWLLLGLLVLAARFMTMTARRTRLIAGATIGLVSVASFGWALFQSTSSPTIAYFSTFTRGWELGVGALIAIAAPVFTRIPATFRTILGYAGLVGIFASCFMITPESTWPAPWALLPVAATGIVIISGIGEAAPRMAPLTNRVSVFIGDISYSLYLWHFPVIVFGHALYPDAGVLAYIGFVIVGFALAIGQYYALELPIWKSPLWGKSQRGAWMHWRHDYSESIKYGAVASLITVTASVVGIAFVPVPEPNYVPTAHTSISPSDRPTSTTPAVDAVGAAVATSLGATTWPSSLTPSIDTVGNGSKASAWVKDGCLALEHSGESDPQATAERCVYGTPGSSERIALIGDSIAISWLPAIQKAFPKAEIHVITMQQCPFAAVSVKKGDGTTFPECDDYHRFTQSKVKALSPTLTLLSQAENSWERRTGDTAMPAGLDATLKVVTQSSRRVAVLTPPPPGRSITDCYSTQGRPSDCAGNLSSKERSQSIDDLSSAIAQYPKARLIDTAPLFCQSGRCTGTAGGFIVRADTSHLTQDYSAYLGPAIGELLKTQS